MTRLTKQLLMLITLVLLSFTAPGVNATTLIIGNNNDLSRYPFGRDPAAASSAFPDFAAGGTYQEVYAAGAFSGPVIITQIAFASKGQLTSGPGIATFNFNLALSTTAVGPGGLSTNLATNRGGDFVQVFTGPLTTVITANDQFDLLIDIAPFTYNPANGNLLLEVTFNSPAQFTGGSALYYNAGFSANTSRAANPSGNPGAAFADGFALQTRFTTRANAQVTLGSLAQTFDGSQKSVAVTTDPPGLEVVVTYDGSAIAPTNAGSYAVVATVNDPNFIGQASGNLTISKADQQIAFGALPNRTFADPDFAVIATASSNLAVSFTANGNCTVNGDQVHLTGAGACTITASQGGNANINAATPIARAFSIAKADQVITFEALADKTLGDPDFTVTASASSNLAVSFSAGGNCTISGDQVHLTGAGPCTVTASQDGDANYNAATAVVRTFTITAKAVAHTPSVTNATTVVNQQTTSGLVIDRNPLDGPEVTHFKITNITNGTLFQNDGNTSISGDQVITYAEGNAGLKFTPAPNLVSPSSTFGFQVQGATSASGDGLSSGFALATINVTCTNQTVTNSNDSGPGSLRDVLAQACPGSLISFDTTPGHVTSPITLTSGELVIDRNLTISGPTTEALTISGNNSSRVFNIASGKRVRISNLTISGGQANAGGGIQSLGNLTITNTTLTGNKAAGGSGDGGAIDAEEGTLFMVNSTISGNTAEGNGGGLLNRSTVLTTLLNVTVANNRADANDDAIGDGGGIAQTSSAALTLRNVLIAGNFKGTASTTSDIFVLQGSTLDPSSANNLIGVDNGLSGLTNGTNGNQIGSAASPIDALLGPLTDNGGPATTHLLLPGSPAIKAGDNTLSDQNSVVLSTDQRGSQRIVNSPIDIGAVEVSYAISATAGTPQSTAIGNIFVDTLQAAVTESGTARGGIPVTFAAPTSGPSGSFSGNPTVTTNSDGVAIAPAFAANSTAGGPYNVTASLSGQSPSALFALTNTAGTAQVVLSNLVQTFDGNPKAVTVVSDPPALSVVVTYNGSTIAPTNSGTYSVSAVVNDANYNGQAGGDLTIQRADQQITFDALPNRTVGDANFNVSSTASSNLAVSFAANGSCTVNGNQVHLTGAGACTITASQNGDANINAAAPVARTFSIVKADQQITFAVLAGRKFGDADFNLNATATSNLAVAFSASGACTVSGNQVHLTGAGVCTITATQDGDANINAAVPVARTFSIGKADQLITFEALTDKKFGDSDFGVNATASSNLAIALAANGNCTVAGTQVHINGAGACTITASQDGDANNNAAVPVARTIFIGKADQQITFAALADKKFGDADFAIAATASSSLAITFAANGNCTLAGTQVHFNGAGACTITATQDGDANINAAAPVARAFSIGKADQQITFAALADKKFGDPDFAIAATASSSLAITFAANGNCTLAGTQVHINGAGACTITATQDGDGNINAAAPVARAFSIGKADQQITFAALADKKFGDADFTVGATASSSLAVVFSAGGNCSVAGTQVHIAGAGPCTITASQDGDANNNAAARVTRTFSIAKADQEITLAALVDKKFGDADFNINATASSNLAVSLAAAGNCTVNANQVHLTGAGPCTITASQGGDANTNAAAPVARTFSIGKSDQQITFEALAGRKFGDADFNVSATTSSNLAVSLAATGNCTVNGHQVHLTGAGPCTITASQDGDANINAAAPVARTFSISKSDQQITFEVLADRKVGEADFTINATASSNLAVSFAANGACTVNGDQVHLTVAGPCTITALQDGNSDYNPAATVARTFAITDQVINRLFSFGAANYEVAESVGVVHINVKRSGDTSGAATVDYVTDDTGALLDCAQSNGRASSHCDFDMALGTLQFAPGEVEKTFDVVINRDSSVEVPSETFSVKLSNPTGGASLDTTSIATVQVDDSSNGVPPDFNVNDDTGAFVRQQYHDFLNREPDPAGLAFWKNNIDQCNDPANRPSGQTLAECVEVQRIVTSAAFFLSIEFRGTGGLVRDFYVAALDRPATGNMPNFLEFEHDTQAAQVGLIVGQGDWQQTLKENRDAFMKDFVTRAEFVGLYPTTDTPAQYVDKLYLHAGLTPGANERSTAIGEFGLAATATDTGARGRALLDITQSPVFQEREINRGFVQMQYFGYLRRNPNDAPDADFAGYEFWLNKLNAAGGNFINAEMVRAFLESREYRARFGP